MRGAKLGESGPAAHRAGQWPRRAAPLSLRIPPSSRLLSHPAFLPSSLLPPHVCFPPCLVFPSVPAAGRAALPSALPLLGAALLPHAGCTLGAALPCLMVASPHNVFLPLPQLAAALSHAGLASFPPCLLPVFASRPPCLLCSVSPCRRSSQPPHLTSPHSCLVPRPPHLACLLSSHLPPSQPSHLLLASAIGNPPLQLPRPKLTFLRVNHRSKASILSVAMWHCSQRPRTQQSPAPSSCLQQQGLSVSGQVISILCFSLCPRNNSFPHPRINS